MRYARVTVVVAMGLMLLAACAPQPAGGPQATSKVSCSVTPMAGPINAAFAGTGQEAKANAIAARESGCDPCSYYPSHSDCSGYNPSTAKGLFQLLGHDDLIHAVCPAFYPLPWMVPDCNARAARALWNDSGWGPWGG